MNTEVQQQKAPVAKTAYQMEKDMKHTHYLECKKEIEKLKAKTDSQHRLLQSIHVLMKNYLAKQEAISDALIGAGVISEQDLNAKIDANLGLRELFGDDEIKIGDVVWVKYTATVSGSDRKFEDGNLPVRVGANAVVFEPALVGKKVGMKGVHFTATLKSGEFAGQDMIFDIEILKAKTKLALATEGVTNGEQSGEQQQSGSQGGDESSSHAEGQGHGESGASGHSTVSEAGLSVVGEGSNGSGENGADPNGVGAGERSEAGDTGSHDSVQSEQLNEGADMNGEEKKPEQQEQDLTHHKTETTDVLVKAERPAEDFMSQHDLDKETHGKKEEEKQ
jgi:hypothetical protein